MALALVETPDLWGGKWKRFETFSETLITSIVTSITLNLRARFATCLLGREGYLGCLIRIDC